MTRNNTQFLEMIKTIILQHSIGKKFFYVCIGYKNHIDELATLFINLLKVNRYLISFEDTN